MKRWYYVAIAAGAVMFAINYFYTELQESMIYVAGALVCLGLGGVAGSVNPVGPMSAEVAPAHGEDRIELPVWRHWLANLLLFAGAILFIMSLFK